MWSISNIDNTVTLSKAQALELAKNTDFLMQVCGEYNPEYQNDKEKLADLFEASKAKYKLKFLEDSMEHMDYVSEICEILQQFKVKGDITFGSLEGDNANSYWGYRFDGKGGVKQLQGAITFVEVP